MEPEAGNNGQLSLRKGWIVSNAVPVTIADGTQTIGLSKHAFAVIRERLSAIVTVANALLVKTMKFFAESLKLVVETTGCLVAAALNQVYPVSGKRVGVIVSGGNIGLASFGRFIA